MKHLFFALVLSLIFKSVFAQRQVPNVYAVIDKKVLSIPDSLTKSTASIAEYINTNFKSDGDKARAAFIWVATNIEYDVENMFALNFYEKPEEKIAKPLNTKKGICENYALLFSDICKKAGIDSYVVSGYTKQNGFADYIPHAWAVANIDSAWFIFDPTWGSGYLYNGKFVKKVNNAYYKSNPAEMLKTHMPFDYLWQFVNYPITNQEFYEGKIQPNPSKPFFNFKDSLRVYESQGKMAQLRAVGRRIEANGVKNSMIFDRLQHVKMSIENENNNAYNLAASDYNEAINTYNEYIAYRNKQFTPLRPDTLIQRMVDLPQNKLLSAKSKLTDIKEPSATTQVMITQLEKSISDATALVNEQRAWLKTYFSKGKIGRKSMFYDKISVFGVPVK